MRQDSPAHPSGATPSSRRLHAIRRLYNHFRCRSGGLVAFQALDEGAKQRYRELAIKKIEEDSASSSRAAVVAGHYMFWDDEAQEDPTIVSTPADWDAYTHMIYLRVPAETVAQRRRDDPKRQRPAISKGHLERWIGVEHSKLQAECLEHGVLFCPLDESDKTLDTVEALLRDFRIHSESHNLSRAELELDKQLAAVTRDDLGLWRTALVFDADRTLTADDTGLSSGAMEREARTS